jgi:glycine cleavage system T protein
MSEPQRTLFYARHKALGGKMVEFGGWDMPVQYPSGPVQEHLATRKGAALFDVSHMGRFLIRGPKALPFLQHVLTNNAEALDGRGTGAQYTLLATETGGAVDDAYLCRFEEEDFLLVVNAANRRKDWEHLQAHLRDFDGVEMVDRTEALVMLALQGPATPHLLEQVVDSGQLPEPKRNAVSILKIGAAPVKVSRTGYTGEPFSFELFADRQDGFALWDLLVEKGAFPTGLAARDTLRLEAGLPLYGHELGRDREGNEIPILAVPLTKFAVSLSPLKQEFVGRPALEKQVAALQGILAGDDSGLSVLPRMIRPIALTGRGVARPEARVFKTDRQAGCVTSGTMVPYWVFEGEGSLSRPTEQHRMRSICLAYIDSNIPEGEQVSIDIRGRAVDAVVVGSHLNTRVPPYARPVVRTAESVGRSIP